MPERFYNYYNNNIIMRDTKPIENSKISVQTSVFVVFIETTKTILYFIFCFPTLNVYNEKTKHCSFLGLFLYERTYSFPYDS